MLLRASPASFVGRKAHRHRVAQLWARSRVVLLVGPAGIGKSTLMRRVVEELGEGRPVHWYGCGSGDDLLAGIEGTLGLTPLATSTDDRILRIAARLESERGILCIDDVHRLAEDEATLWQLATQLRIGQIVATSRSAVALGELETSAAVVPLGPLTPDEATTLVRDLLERLGRDGDAAGIAFRAAGNPLWCRLLAGGAQRVERHLDSVLGALGTPARGGLDRLSVLREAVPVSWAGIDDEALHELEMRCLVERASDGMLTVHDVVREIVVGRLAPGDLAVIHRDCADSYAREPEGVEGELYHREAAGDVAGLARTLHERGAAWIWVQRRVDEYERMAAMIEEAGVPLTPRLWLRRALCASVQGRLREARAAFDAAGEVPADDRLLAAAAEIDILRGAGAPYEAREERFHSALAAAGSAVESVDRGPLMDSYIRDAVLTWRVEGAIEVYRMLRQSPGLVEPQFRSRISNRVGYMFCERGDRAGALDALQTAHACAAQLGSPQLMVAIEALWTVVDTRFGDLAAAEEHLAKADRWPLPAGEPSSLVALEVARAGVHRHSGRLVLARDGLEAVCARGLLLMGPIRSTLYSELAMVSAELGDHARARSAAHEALRGWRALRFDIADVTAHAALARAELDLGRATRARRRAGLAVALAERQELGYRGAEAELVLAEAEIALGHAEGAQRALDRVIERARLMGSRTVEVQAQLLSAQAALRQKKAETAQHAAGEALRIASASGYPLLAARAHLLLGWSAAMRDREADASEQLAAAAAAQSEQRPGLEGDVELLRRVLRALSGNRSARAAVEQRLLGSTSLLAAVARTELRRHGAEMDRAAVTRRGKQALKRAAAPEEYDLWVDGATGRVRIDGVTDLDLASRPVLLKLLCVVLAEPTKHFDKAQLLSEVWNLPHRTTREPMLQKAVQRLGRLLSPEQPHRFFGWDADGKLELKAQQPCLVLAAPESSLNDRQRWLVDELGRRPSISSGEYRSALHIARITAYRDLEQLVELGLIRRKGRGRAVVYERQ